MDVDRIRLLGLRKRMALSYLSTSVLVTVLVVVLIQTMALAAGSTPAVDAARQTARDSASAIAQASAGPVVSSPPLRRGNLTFPSDAVVTPTIGQLALALPHIYGLEPGPSSAEMVVDSSGTVIATSYPSHFQVGRTLASLVPAAGGSLLRVLAGYPAHGETSDTGGRVAWALEPIGPDFGSDFGSATSAVYVQIGEPGTSVWDLIKSDLFDMLIATLALAPVGALFGILTMWATVRRIIALAEASKALASGDFSQRVQARGRDEVAALQRQFNLTAGRLETVVETLLALAANNARLSERHRIARELHDSICQELFSLRMEVGGLEVSLAADRALLHRLNGIGESLTATIRQMRMLLLELRPCTAVVTQLPSALRQLAASYRMRAGIDVHADVTLESTSLTPQAEENLLRIAQEALANAARHSGAARIEVGLRRTDDGMELCIADDGRGFEPRSVEGRGGLGLALLRDRAVEAVGQLRIESTAGSGTRVSVRVPQ